MVKSHCNKKQMFLKQWMQQQRQHGQNAPGEETFVFAEVKREHRKKTTCFKLKFLDFPWPEADRNKDI